MRYRNVNTGAIVSVREDKVLGAEWEVQSKPKPKAEPKKAPAKDASPSE